MARVAYVEQDQAADSLKPIYEGITRKTGHVTNFLKVLARSPELFHGFLAINGSLGKFSLDRKLRELAYLYTSELNGCDYCCSHHRQGAAKAGASDRQIEEITRFETSDAFDDRTRLVLRYAEQVTRTGRVDSGLADQIKAVLNDRELVELTAAIALANFTNRINTALEVELP